jgi:hypothetical protein
MMHLHSRTEPCDLKLNQREEFVAFQHLRRLRICKCNICRGEKKSLRRTDVVGDHLNKYGHAPFLKGSRNISSTLTIR